MVKKKFWKKAVSLIAVAAMLTGCGQGSGKKRDTLVIGTSNFSQKFSPFFSETVYDKMCQTLHR